MTEVKGPSGESSPRPLRRVWDYEVPYLSGTGARPGIGIPKPITHPENLPETIVVMTPDFLRLIYLAGNLCDPAVPDADKPACLALVKEIAARHRIDVSFEFEIGDRKPPEPSDG